MSGTWNVKTSLILLMAILPACWAQQNAAHQPHPIGTPIRTSSGFIVGHAAPHRPEVSEYLGIPYASPPTGRLRFAPPVNYVSNDTILADSYSLDCPANIAPPPSYPGLTPQGPGIIELLVGQNSTPKGEDCLYLNVWTRPAASLKPVLVAIHGGRYETGSVNNALYDGQELAADHDAVVVTINYRVDIFGFPGAPGLSQNVGLLDQRMAIEWIHRNIAGFGGDANRITIFGQSAGASSVDIYSYAWADDPIVSGLISHSGTALSFVPNTPEDSAMRFYNVSHVLGCGDASDNTQEVIDCVRQKPWQDVMDASENLPPILSATIPLAPFHPTVDGIIVFDNYTERSAAGEFAPLPYLVTSNNNEAAFYKISAYAFNISLSQATWDNFTLAAFTCPSAATVKDRAAHGVPAWQSRYFAQWHNLRLYPGSGAYHASDLPMVLNTAERTTGSPNSDRQAELARYMGSAWVAFASDPHDGLTRFGWPRYNPLEPTLMGLGYMNSTTAQFLRPAEIDRDCVALHGDITPGSGAI
ncbi:Carboxylesterase type B [Penicillium hispanicum]|uniref:Carboxylesterase type B n=1 Tax=Penicillium hispanicum TaxID=1080232 RepID=UPI00254079F3|nr:Carboxylesterase type B [Penicillium hispanicum]KAJ5584948.1 Carboxylesterase type B [Penicillium hispanicum]